MIAKAGAGSLIASGIWKTVLFIFISPVLGFLLGALLMVAVANIFRQSSPLKVDNLFRRLQLVSAGLYSLGHGGNDAQKTIGIIWMLLIASGYAQASASMPPAWVIWCCYVAIGLGTMFGGWRIVRTMGQKITKLKPVGGFCAEAGGAITLFPGDGRSASRCRPRTPSPARSSASARCGVRQTVRWGVAGNIRLGLDLHDPGLGLRRRRVLRPEPVAVRLSLAGGVEVKSAPPRHPDRESAARLPARRSASCLR